MKKALAVLLIVLPGCGMGTEELMCYAPFLVMIFVAFVALAVIAVVYVLSILKSKGNHSLGVKKKRAGRPSGH
jgi:hypothetical protein